MKFKKGDKAITPAGKGEMLNTVKHNMGVILYQVRITDNSQSCLGVYMIVSENSIIKMNSIKYNLKSVLKQL